MASFSQRLYIGVSNNIVRRVYQHKSKQDPQSFTSRYNIDRLVYVELYQDVNEAIAREKQLKGWLRKKIALIDTVNPNWRDLTLDWE
jgi:putative endonuclease